MLFIATELLLLQREPWSGLKLSLIEEIEAHLHPQAQMRVVEFLHKEALNNSYQLILTTHSPNLASKVELENLIVCTSNGQAFSMGKGYTHLDDNIDDYKFLRRFLDVTKANLFFSKGVILVEGFAESILIPVIAEKIGKPLTMYGISVINVGSKAFLRFAKIFCRTDGKFMPIKVSVITDYDFRPTLFSTATNKDKRRKELIEDSFSKEEKIKMLKSRRIKNKNIKTFFSHKWTLEYCLSLSPSLRKPFYLAVLHAWLEKKRAQGIKSTKTIDKKIKNLQQQFNNWTNSDEEIAFEIYQKIILDKQLSKAAIAQYFSQMIESGDAILNSNDKAIGYITNAINFVTS